MNIGQLLINCDMGESYGRFVVSDEEAIMPLIHACNIACGYHAGDPVSIEKTIELALKNDVKIGAHPSYPDLAGFGRRKMDIDPLELEVLVRYQIAAVQGMAHALGAVLYHVKPHGALYNFAGTDEPTAAAICRAVKSINKTLVVFAPYNSVLATTASQMNLTVHHEAFIDRLYKSDLSLLSRNVAGSVIQEPDMALAQVRSILVDRNVRTYDGQQVYIEADTFCIHGDNPAALKILEHIQTHLKN